MDFSSLAIHSNPDAYWCPDCHKFTLDCAHLVEPLTTPAAVFKDSAQYIEATWAKGVLQVRMNTGEGYQFFNVPRWLAVAFVKNPDSVTLKGYRFQRVRGRIPIPQRFGTKAG